MNCSNFVFQTCSNFTCQTQEIVDGFKKLKKITVTDIPLSHSSDMQYVTSFSDPDFAEQFKKYHGEHANLEMFKKYERT